MRTGPAPGSASPCLYQQAGPAAATTKRPEEGALNQSRSVLSPGTVQVSLVPRAQAPDPFRPVASPTLGVTLIHLVWSAAASQQEGSHLWSNPVIGNLVARPPPAAGGWGGTVLV